MYALAAARGDVGAVAQQLGPLAQPLDRALGRMTTARDRLEDADRARGQTTPADPAARTAADRAVDTAWSAFEGWLGGWCRLEDHGSPSAADARRVYDRLFPDGLRFIKMEFKLEWAESRKRLGMMETEGLRPIIEQLGGRRFVDQIAVAQARYGEVLNITTAAPESAPAARVRTFMDAAHAALRDYVSKVVALRDPEVAGSDALADRLLKPLLEWDETRATPGGRPAPTPSPGGGPGPE
ncbi:MAG: hypothetical protein HY906_05965 [Deltaproteobacteria bacterium]|nr:hypothetical protein [Deltaproteobacteria bacterium]